MIPKFSELQELRRLRSESSSSSSSTYAPKKPFVKKDWKNKGTIIVTTILPGEIPIPTSPNLISVFLTFPSQAESQRRINVEGLLGTGCLAGDFVARRIVDRLNIKPILQSTAKLSVCSGLDNTLL